MDREDRHAFVATVRNPEKSVKGALEAAGHQGVRFCIETYGTSDIDWEVAPTSDPADFEGVTGELSLRGRCRDT